MKNLVDYDIGKMFYYFCFKTYVYTNSYIKNLIIIIISSDLKVIKSQLLVMEERDRHEGRVNVVCHLKYQSR